MGSGHRSNRVRWDVAGVRGLPGRATWLEPPLPEDLVSVELSLILGLTVKHFVCDFPLQAFPWMYKNKGTYGHPGGLAHAGVHLVGSALVLWAMAPGFISLALADFFIHYHIDWAKMSLGKRWGLRPDNSEWFWILLGLDQLLHSLTYIGMVWMILG